MSDQTFPPAAFEVLGVAPWPISLCASDAAELLDRRPDGRKRINQGDEPCGQCVERHELQVRKDRMRIANRKAAEAS